MGLIAELLAVFGIVFVAALGRILGEDAKTFIPKVCNRIISYSAEKLSRDAAERYHEEWLSHSNEIPELTGKLYHAISLAIYGSNRIGRQVGFRPANRISIRVFKRSFDVLCALAALPMIAAVAAVIFLLNPLFNAGPAFFIQTMRGKDGRPIRVVKFRTMSRASEEEMRSIKSGLKVDRFTPLGVFLRRYRIDELPQFLNVLKGDISIIGPRADQLDKADVYASQLEGCAERLSVKPGITGLAQTERDDLHGTESIRHEVRADKLYIDNMSLWMELRIFWRTIKKVFTTERR